METKLRLPSIFNDVIGPVMRGPSSSHCAASLRIGRFARDLMAGRIDSVHVRFDRAGSLAQTHHSQGSDMGLCGGLLGWEATDPRLVDSQSALADAGIDLRIEIADLGDPHPNTYRLELVGGGERHELVAISTGGGMMEIVEIDGAAVSLLGDRWASVWFGGVEQGLERCSELVDCLTTWEEVDCLTVYSGPAGHLVLACGDVPLGAATEAAVRQRFPGWTLRRIAPVLPVLTPAGMAVPYATAAEMLAYNEGRGLALWELAVTYEQARGGLAEAQVLAMMAERVAVMRGGVAIGLQGTEYADRILGPQAGRFVVMDQAGRLLDGGVLNRMIAYVTALMEAKSAMEVIVAAPTAGSCGGLPGACLGAADAMGLADADVTRAMLAAGMIGVFICGQATFAAEVAGCQAECGAGSAMAAAALVNLAGGSARQAVDAASMALQNTLGMICDPVATRVEVPCLGKNVLAAANALACANMALAGFNAVIPLDEVIQAMAAVGCSLPSELRCTALGGLSVTPAAREVERRLRGE